MSIFSRIFDVFSTRPEASLKPEHAVPETTRMRIVMLCREVFSNDGSGYAAAGFDSTAFWNAIHRLLCFRHGRAQLTNSQVRSEAEDALQFVMTCDGAEFLDFIEDIFQVDCWFHGPHSPDQTVEDINVLLRQDNLPYHLTGFVRQTKREMVHGGPFGGEEHEVTRTLAMPRIIMRENEAIYDQAIAPVLELLQRPEYASAQSEYMSALEDYRKDDFGDCLTKCGSAFESVLKIICARKKWPFTQNDTAGTLVKTFIAKTQLEPYFDQMLMTTAVLRNKLSASHGAGTEAKNVSANVALYALNVTASAILFAVRQVGDS